MSPDFNATLTTTLIFLLVLTALAILVYIIWRHNQLNTLPWQKTANPPPHKRLQIIERTPLSPQHQLVLVQCDNHQYLILTHPTHSTITPISREHKKSPSNPYVNTKNPPLILKYAKNRYSQNGEDGIFKYIFSQLALQKGMFAEFGAWDGITLSNCRALFEQGWHGLFIEGNKKRFQNLKKNYHHEKNIITVQKYIETKGKNSLDAIFKEHKIKHIDLLSIDIDSLDLAIWKSLKTVRPTVVCIEYNPTIPFDVRHEATADNPSTLNAPLSIYEWAQHKQYDLVAMTDTNLIFIDQKARKKTKLQTLTLQHYHQPLPRLAFSQDGRILYFDPQNPHNISPEIFENLWHNHLVKQPFPKILLKHKRLAKLHSRLSAAIFYPLSYLRYKRLRKQARRNKKQ
ncbi:MAG: flagellar biosynthetic protein FliO [Alphaproteobacteria bacterium GM202ARS2]|nr:flagellar biosynthetic protein FliO [Alphaproteobacteria bacterium GM202ARS2]